MLRKNLTRAFALEHRYFAWHGKKLDFNSSNSNDDDEMETISAKFREEDVIAENSDFNRKWFGGRKRKSSLVRHFRRKRNSMSSDSGGPKSVASSSSVASRRRVSTQSSRRRVSTSMLSVKKTMSIVPE